jgi:electron transport complex protein RnfB
VVTALLTALIALVILGAAVGVILALASLKLQVEVNPLIEQIEAVLPGANCGACGKPGCCGYAAEIINSNAPVDLCHPGGAEVAAEIARIMGKEIPGKKIRKVAFVFCKGGKRAATKFKYSGIQTCQAAMLTAGGQKACKYGCLGFGDCVKACKFDAIKMLPDGYPVVDSEACVDCLACIKACPKQIIQETTHKEVKRVVCNSHDNGKVSRSVCEVSCIACNICVKSCPYEAIVLDNNLAVIDPEKCTNCGICVEKCPTRAIT